MLLTAQLPAPDRSEAKNKPRVGFSVSRNGMAKGQEEDGCDRLSEQHGKPPTPRSRGDHTSDQSDQR